MNRCAPPGHPAFPTSSAGRRAALRWLLAVTGVAVFTLAAAPAHAGLRMFPVGTRRGEITFSNPPQVQLHGNTEQLSSGTRIHDANNRLVFANTLKGQTFVVNYVRDGNRTIREIWILTPGEIQEKLPLTQDNLNRIQQSQNIVPPSMPN
ncbi:MAG: hypothetical protein LBH31_00720 [Burkholderiaceae bacterium]|jgi:hypothetical protein|nr:hypothetical protein [Burkholderiaceae bacterium]